MLPTARAALFSAVLSLAAVRPAAAESTPRRFTPETLRPAASRQAGNDHLGLLIIIGSLAAGAAITAYGLTIDCGPRDHGCHRRASLPLGGGIGVAAAGTLVGLSILQSPDGTSSATAFSISGRLP